MQELEKQMQAAQPESLAPATQQPSYEQQVYHQAVPKPGQECQESNQAEQQSSELKSAEEDKAAGRPSADAQAVALATSQVCAQCSISLIRSLHS